MTRKHTYATVLQQLEDALREEKLTDSTAGNVRRPLVDARYAEYAPRVADHVERGQWQELEFEIDNPKSAI